MTGAATGAATGAMGGSACDINGMATSSVICRPFVVKFLSLRQTFKKKNLLLETNNMNYKSTS